MTKRLADGTEVVSTICDQCHATCGALAHVQNGRVVKLRGFLRNPHAIEGTTKHENEALTLPLAPSRGGLSQCHSEAIAEESLWFQLK